MLVGPNNVGKSQFLRDILSIMSKEGPKKVLIKDIDFEPINDFRSSPPMLWSGIILTKWPTIMWVV